MAIEDEVQAQVVEELRMNGGMSLNARSGEKTVLGGSGTAYFQGLIVDEEYNPDLMGERGIRVYDQMARSDGQASVMLRVLKLPLLRARWHIEPASDSVEDKKIAQTVQDNLMGGMARTWSQILEHFLTAFQFGHSVSEKVWAKPNGDGLVLYRNIAPRLAKTIYRWYPNEDDEIEYIEQRFYRPKEDGTNEYVIQPIPGKKLVVFTIGQEGANFAGVSLYRAAYKHWFYKDQFYRIDAIAGERNGMGVPVAMEPEKVSVTDRNKTADVLASFHAHQKGYLIFPHGYEFDLKGVNGSIKDLLPSIEHHDLQMSRSILAAFLNLDQGGSFALSKDGSTFFLKATQAYAQAICDVVDKDVIRPLVDMNYRDIERYPSLHCSELDTRNIPEFLATIPGLFSAGILTNDLDTENVVRTMLDLPEKKEPTPEEIAAQQAAAGGAPPPPGSPGAAPVSDSKGRNAEDEEDDEDPQTPTKGAVRAEIKTVKTERRFGEEAKNSLGDGEDDRFLAESASGSFKDPELFDAPTDPGIVDRLLWSFEDVEKLAQARVPAGSPKGGQFSSGSGGGFVPSANAGTVLSNDDEMMDAAAKVVGTQLLGDLGMASVPSEANRAKAAALNKQADEADKAFEAYNKANPTTPSTRTPEYYSLMTAAAQPRAQAAKLGTGKANKAFLDEQKALKKEHGTETGAFNKKLTASEKAAMGEYAGAASYKDINEALRSGGSHPAVSGIDSAIAKGSFPKDMQVYRGVSGDWPGMDVGATLKDNGFMSVSRDPRWAVRFTAGDQGSSVFRINARAGQKAAYGAKDETEHILPRGSSLKITAKTVSPNGWTIYDADIIDGSDLSLEELAQARHPAGSPKGGQFASTGGGNGLRVDARNFAGRGIEDFEAELGAKLELLERPPVRVQFYEHGAATEVAGRRVTIRENGTSGTITVGADGIVNDDRVSPEMQKQRRKEAEARRREEEDFDDGLENYDEDGDDWDYDNPHPTEYEVSDAATDTINRWSADADAEMTAAAMIDEVYSVESMGIKASTTYSSDGTNGYFTANFEDANGDYIGQAERVLKPDGTVYHSLFQIERDRQGEGLAAAVNQRAERFYLEQGFERIELQADIDVGKYAWARQGYDFKNPEAEIDSFKRSAVRVVRAESPIMSQERAEAYVDRLVGNKQHAWELAALDDGIQYPRGGGYTVHLGKKAMLEGESWDGIKDLTPGSPSRIIGDAYYASKGLEIE